jgi:hypothetical protein
MMGHEGNKPRRGDICLCSLDHLGVITSKGMVEVTYPDGNTGRAYVGVHIWPEPGTPWSSRTPRIIGSAPVILDKFLEMEKEDDE